MKKIIMVLILAYPLFAAELTLKEGFVAAHTEMIMDSTIDPLNTNLKGKMSITGDDLLSLKGTLSIQMDLFTSDNEDRDEHMHEANEASQFPLASYTITSVTQNTKGDYTLHGTMTFHGQDKPFIAQAEIIDTKDEIIISATSHLLVSDFGIEAPCMMFMCVRDKVDIFAKAIFLKNSDAF